MIKAIISLIKGITTGNWTDFLGDKKTNKQGCLSWVLGALIGAILGLITQNPIVGIVSFLLSFMIFLIIFRPKN